MARVELPRCRFRQEEAGHVFHRGFRAAIKDCIMGAPASFFRRPLFFVFRRLAFFFRPASFASCLQILGWLIQMVINPCVTEVKISHVKGNVGGWDIPMM